MEWGEVNSEYYGTLNINRSQVRDGGIKHLKTQSTAMLFAAMGKDCKWMTAIAHLVELFAKRCSHREIYETYVHTLKIASPISRTDVQTHTMRACNHHSVGVPKRTSVVPHV